MASWKTTVFGAIAAVAQYAKTQFPEYSGIADGIAGLALALMGYFAADAK